MNAIAEAVRMTPDEFERYALLPENEAQILELICGEVIDIPSNPFSSYVGSIIVAALMAFVRPRKLGYVTGEAGGYCVGAERYAPDAAFISFARQPELAHSGCWAFTIRLMGVMYCPALPCLSARFSSSTLD